MPVTEGSGAHYKGFRCPLKGGQVPIVGGSGAHYWGLRCPLWGAQVPIMGGSGSHYDVSGGEAGTAWSAPPLPQALAALGRLHGRHVIQHRTPVRVHRQPLPRRLHKQVPIHQGTAVQVEPIKPRLNAPET